MIICLTSHKSSEFRKKTRCTLISRRWEECDLWNLSCFRPLVHITTQNYRKHISILIGKIKLWCERYMFLLLHILFIKTRCVRLLSIYLMLKSDNTCQYWHNYSRYDYNSDHSIFQVRLNTSRILRQIGPPNDITDCLTAAFDVMTHDDVKFDGRTTSPVTFKGPMQ